MTTIKRKIEICEEAIGQGDIAGMAKVVEEIHLEWDSLDEDTQNNVKSLEGIFLSMVNLKIGNK